MLIQPVTFERFAGVFRAYERRENFSFEALRRLYEYYQEYYNEKNVEIDVISICCDWGEYDKYQLEMDFSHRGDTAREIISSFERDGVEVIPLSKTWLIPNH